MGPNKNKIAVNMKQYEYSYHSSTVQAWTLLGFVETQNKMAASPWGQKEKLYAAVIQWAMLLSKERTVAKTV